ncbi:MAG TPA: hypothetical protein PLP21_09450 [Pyrinomonadaceae bacterium]|nr:hypothetical protein [Acidobacteriota bacterium]HQZ96531.1 hypothetical protein [Pyrinomonadaceae bacterium]
MRTNTIITAGILAISAGLVGCGAPAANTNANKPANTNANKPAANAPANTTAANTAAAPASDGQVIKLDEAGIMMTVPKGFKFSKDGEDTIVKTEDEGVDIRFTVPKDGDYEKAMGDAGTEIDDYLDDVKIEKKDVKTVVDGMEATTLSGTAKNAGESLVWNLTIIKTPKKPVIVNIYAEKASLDKNGAAVKAFFESIKKQ